MLHNYLSTALRNFRRRFGYTAINVTGLSIGLACCLLIASFVRSELQFDRFHEKADRIYRVNTHFVGRGDGSFTDGRVGPALVDEIPQVEAAVRISRTEHLVRHGATSTYGWDVAFVDSTFFQVFDFELIRGLERNALSAPRSIVLTETMVETFFPDQDPLGETITLDGEKEFTVTGVLEDVPVASHYQFDALAPFDAAREDRPWLENWGSIALNTYVLLAPGVSSGDLTSSLESFADRHYAEGGGEPWQIPSLYPLTSIHLKSHTYELEAQGDIESVYVMGTIGLFILILACINYMNLATARAARRAKEVGIRKVSGARPAQLIAQFMTESITLSVLSVLLAVGLSFAVHPLLSDLFALAPFPLAFVHSALGLWLLLGSGILVGLLAGVYPAFVLTRYAPVAVLKGVLDKGSGSRFRKVLVITQFVVSIALLAGTLVAMRQLDFMKERDLGFDRENVVNVFVRDPHIQEDAETLRQRLIDDGDVVSATISSTAVSEFSRSAPVSRVGGEGDDDEPTIGFIFTDSNFIPTMGMKMAAGENFREGSLSGSNEVVISAESARRLGFEQPQDALGEELQSSFFSDGSVIIRGVVEDFHVRSLRSPVTPVMLLNARLNDDALLSVRLAQGDQSETIEKIRQMWQETIPEWPFEYVYLDDVLQQRSAGSRRMARMFGVFSALAILIGCLGLFGLAAHMAERRTREIGIRKALGASARQVVLLLSKEFALLVTGSIIIAAPLVKLGMERWLDDFAYRIDWSWDIILWAGIATLLLAVVTVSTQAARAALINPVDALRDE